MTEIPVQHWTKTIEPRRRLLDLRFGEVWAYRYLVLLFVRRDFVAVYKQTALGPFWWVFQPIASTLVFTVVFGGIAKISTDGSPQPLFYMAGVVVWGYFSSATTSIAGVFTYQRGLFNKVYFPRLVVPFSIMIYAMIVTGIQLTIFAALLAYYRWHGMVAGPGVAIVLLPFLFLLLSMLALGVGSIFTALTLKYRDLSFLLMFGMQLAMYATTVIYPLSYIPEKYRPLALVNPATSIVETFRFATLGTGAIPVEGLIYATAVSVMAFVIGIVVFNIADQTATDLA